MAHSDHNQPANGCSQCSEELKSTAEEIEERRRLAEMRRAEIAQMNKGENT